MTCVVISQPMFFPWVGMFEQFRLADVYVHYDDVQFSKGSFTNRVQIKTARGNTTWLTVPLPTLHLGQAIRDVRVDPDGDWKRRHLAFLEQAFRGAAHADDALGIVRAVYAEPFDDLASLAQASMAACWRYYGMEHGKRVLVSSAMGIGGSSWPRVLETVKAVGGDTYVTGHGAAGYLDHEAFEAAGVRVEYMRYEKRPYAQLHGAFTPYVSILDLIANEGVAGRVVIASSTVHWKGFRKP